MFGCRHAEPGRPGGKRAAEGIRLRRAEVERGSGHKSQLESPGKCDNGFGQQGEHCLVPRLASCHCVWLLPTHLASPLSFLPGSFSITMPIGYIYIYIP